jgi:adenosylcobyric acid synthase
MVGRCIDDPLGVEGPAGSVDGLDWLPLSTTFEADKVLDRPRGTVARGPGAGEVVDGYRIHHGRVTGTADVWIEGRDGAPLGWQSDRVLATTLHAVFENDGLRAAVLRWAAERTGATLLDVPLVSFAAARQARLDRIADTLEAHLDLDRVLALVSS